MKNNCERDINIIEFNQYTRMEWRAWLLYFEGYCRDSKKDNIWKIRNIQKFLKGKALTRPVKLEGTCRVIQ